MLTILAMLTTLTTSTLALKTQTTCNPNWNSMSIYRCRCWISQRYQLFTYCILQVSDATDGPVQHAASRPSCCTTKVDAQCGKMPTVVSQTKLTTLAMVDVLKSKVRDKVLDGTWWKYPYFWRLKWLGTWQSCLLTAEQSCLLTADTRVVSAIEMHYRHDRRVS